MTDIEQAKNALGGHSLALCKNGKIIITDLRGVAPMLNFIKNGEELSGYSAADKVVGKAAAALFIKAGVKEIYAEVLSQSGLEFLTEHNVKISYGKLIPFIENRKKDGLCPMESVVQNQTDVETCFNLIANKFASLSSASAASSSR